MWTSTQPGGGMPAASGGSLPVAGSPSARDDRPLFYALIALGGTVFVVAALVCVSLDTIDWLAGLAAVGLLALTSRRTVVFLPAGRSFISVSEPLVFATLLLSGAPLAIVVAGCDALISSRPKNHPVRSRLLSLALMSLSVSIAAYALELLAPHGFRNTTPINSLVPAVLACAVVHFLINSLSVAGLAARRRGLPIAAIWWNEYAWAAPSYVVSAGAALLAFAASAQWGPIALLIGVPTIGIVGFFYWSHVERLRAGQAHIEELRRVNGQIMDALALAIEARDPHARGHSRRVQAYAEELGHRVQAEATTFAGREVLDAGWLETLSAAALLHDAGKLALPDHLLFKRGPLRDSERDKVRQHAMLGEAMVGRLAFAHPVGPMIRHHHEHWDGSGYPDGLAGEAIPLAARILALGDTLDLARRDACAGAVTVEYLTRRVGCLSGSKLDPRLCELYCKNAEAIEAKVDEQARLTNNAADAPADSSTLLADMGNARREAVFVYDITRQMSSSLDIDDTLKTAMAGLAEVIPASSAAVYLADESGTYLVPRFASGPLSTVLLDRSFSRGEGVTGWVFQGAEAVIDADPRVDLGSAAEQTETVFKSAAVFPLTDDDGALGVIAFYDTHAGAFDSDHRRIMETVGPQIARALRNALLYQATQNTSMTDVLTGLPNSRYLYGQIDKELARATRRASPLCVVVMDLDGFKSVNDTYGHRAGDAVLRAVAYTLRDAYRAVDTVVRYAGDEFVALLPDSSPDECQAVIERVQAAVSKTKVTLAGGVSVSVGISAGFACFPLNGSTLEDLIHRADKEMYRDKNARKGLALSGTRQSSEDR